MATHKDFSHAQPGIKFPRLTGLRTLRVACLGISLLALNAQAGDLPALVSAALQSHPSLVNQQNLGEAARAGVEAARWQFFPTPGVNVEHARTSDPAYRGDDIQTTASLQQPLWTGGRLSGNLDQARARALAARADQEITRQQLALRVIQSWSDAVAAQLKFNAYAQSRDTHQRLLELVQRRAGDGVSAQSDVDLARQRLDGVEADWMSARAQRDSALARLNLITGGVQIVPEDLPQDISTGPGVAIDLQRPLPEWMDAARDISPQVVKARSEAAIAEAEIAVSRARLSPEVYVRAERQWGDVAVPDSDPQNRLLFGVTSNFGAGLSGLSGVSAARAQHRAALATIDSEKLAVDEQVRTDLTLAQTSKLRQESLLRARGSAGEIATSWERQFLAGRKQWVDLMNAAREQAQVDVQLADAIGAQELTGWRLRVLSAGVDAITRANTQP